MLAIDEAAVRFTTWILLSTSCLTVMLVTLSIVLRTQKDVKRGKETGKYCGHCGDLTQKEPSRAIALTDSSYYVYTCRTCRKETVLPSP